jgi:hypothetical protein
MSSSKSGCGVTCKSGAGRLHKNEKGETQLTIALLFLSSLGSYCRQETMGALLNVSDYMSNQMDCDSKLILVRIVSVLVSADLTAQST